MTERATTARATETMDAVRLHAPGGLDALAFDRIAVPAVGDGEALVRVHAAAITRDELGWPVDRLPAIPSYELSGVVAAIAPDVEGVSVGDDVFALTPFDRVGVAAGYAVVPANVLAPKPRTLDHLASAAVPLPALSAWQALFDHGGLEDGRRVLISGAAGDVGHFAVQLARHRGAFVVGTTSAASADRARGFGVQELVEPGAMGSGAIEPVDLVFDTVGGAILAGSSAILRRGGRIVTVAEEPPEGVDADFFVVEPSRAQLVQIARLVDAGVLSPAIDSVFALPDARAAFERSMGPGKRGKVVLRVSDD